MLFALPAAAQTGPVGSPTCADANLTLAPGETSWNCYEFYDPIDPRDRIDPLYPTIPEIEYITVYDMVPLDVRDAGELSSRKAGWIG
ncbi:MAG: hypothetical protein AAFY02_12545 [Pseudomonadota bacterium]